MPQPPTEQRRSSTIRRETIAGQTVFVKRYHGGDWGKPQDVMEAQAAAEVEIVRRLSDLREKPARLGCMKIVAIDADEASLTTAEIAGEPLERLILRSGSREHRGTCLRALLLAGRWQRMLQAIDTDGFSPTIAETEPFEMIDYCNIRLQTILDLHPAWPTKLEAARILGWLKRQMDATLPEQQRKVWCHGDYGPTNFLWDRFTLTPIDFATCCLNYPLVDITYLIHRLEMLRWQFPWRRFPVDLWRRACLRGIGSAASEELPIYRALMVRHILCRLQTILYFEPRDKKQHWHNLWVCRCLRNRIQQLISQP